MSRRGGFSLAEIGMAVAILVTVGSAVGATGSVVMNRVKEQELIERVKDFYQAGEKSLAVLMESGRMDRYTGFVDSTPYMHDRTLPTWNWNVKNPYTLTDDGVIVDYCNTDGGYCDSYPSATYGAGLIPIKGRVIYFVAWTTSVRAFRVWNGVTDVYFRDFALQGINQLGYPVVTLGR